MTDAPNPALQLTDPDNVRTVFINGLSGSGFLNGVINLTLETARFTPIGDGVEVRLDRIIAARLRMDLYAASQIHATLGRMLQQQTQLPSEPVQGDSN